MAGFTNGRESELGTYGSILLFSVREALRKYLVLGTMLVFGGSATGCVHFRDRPLSAEQVQSEFSARTLADAGLKTFIDKNRSVATSAWPLTYWDFDDLSLAAYYFQPDLDIARAQLESADAAKKTAAQRLNPTINLVPAYDTSTPPPWILGINLDIPIETAGKRGYRVAEAAHEAESARYGLATTAWAIRSRVRQTMLALYAAQERTSLLSSQQVVQEDSLHLLEAQLQVGAISPFEVTQSRVTLNQIRFARRDAELGIVNARLQLAAAIGVPVGALEGVGLDFSEFEHPPRDVADATARRLALVNRADIRGALEDYAATQSALQLEIAKQYPDIHLGPGYQRDQADDKWSLGAGFELPLFNRNRGAIATAEARRAESAARFNALQARVLSQIEQAAATYRALAEKVSAAETLSRELTTQLHTAQAMRDVGEISRVELAQRQLELTTAALAQLDAKIGAQEALGALSDALQSPAELTTDLNATH